MNLSDMIFDTLRPDGPTAKLAALLGTIDNARGRLALMSGGCELHVAEIACEEIGKIILAKQAYDHALGAP